MNENCRYRIVLNSDHKSFDGHGRINDQQEFFTENIVWDERDFSIRVNSIFVHSSHRFSLFCLSDLSSNTYCIGPRSSQREEMNRFESFATLKIDCKIKKEKKLEIIPKSAMQKSRKQLHRLDKPVHRRTTLCSPVKKFCNIRNILLKDFFLCSSD